MTARALRQIEAELFALAADFDAATPEAITLQARRVGAQAEMIEEGISE